MRNALPGMPAALALLKQRLPRADDGRKKPRLQRLYRLASGRAQSRQEGARVLGGQRHPSGHWRASYEAGGLAALRAVYRPPGKAISLPPEVLAALEQSRRPPTGVAAYEALRQGVKQTPHLEVNDHTLSPIGRKRCKAKLKVPRPSHTKKP